MIFKLFKLQDWFDVHDPFDEDEPSLKSLSSGLIGDEAVNWGEAEENCWKIQETLDGVKMEEASIKRKNKVQNFFNFYEVSFSWGCSLSL